jgi:hypothetical protein
LPCWLHYYNWHPGDPPIRRIAAGDNLVRLHAWVLLAKEESITIAVMVPMWPSGCEAIQGIGTGTVLTTERSLSVVDHG